MKSQPGKGFIFQNMIIKGMIPVLRLNLNVWKLVWVLRIVGGDGGDGRWKTHLGGSTLWTLLREKLDRTRYSSCHLLSASGHTQAADLGRKIEDRF